MVEARVLRCTVEVFSRDNARRNAIGEQLCEAGFRLEDEPRAYTQTVAVDLQPDEREILARLHRTARYNLRAVNKNPVTVRTIVDTDHAPRMRSLLAETMARTGGTAAAAGDLKSLIAFGHDHPHLVRSVGLFRTDVAGSDGLLAFACSDFHGDHARYALAASTRKSDLRMSLGYALVWDLMLWAKRCGADWFDLGGVTRGTTADASDPLGGISDFKRFFSKNVVHVHDEWVFVPHRIRGAIADRVSAVAASIIKIVDANRSSRR